MFKKCFAIVTGLYLLCLVFSSAEIASAANFNCACSGGYKTQLTACAGCTGECQKQTPPQTMVSCAEAADLPNQTAGSVSLKNPLSVSTPQALIGKVINAVLGVVGSIALLMFVYGGLVWMTSSGAAEKVKQGREIIIWSAIGLAIIFASYGLVRILINAVQ